MNLKPLSNHIFIKPEKQERVTKSGIIIPDTVDTKKLIGVVVAVGPGKLNEKGERIPMSVKVGDKVLFKKYGPDDVELDPIEVNQEKYLVGDEDDIFAIIE